MNGNNNILITPPFKALISYKALFFRLSGQNLIFFNFFQNSIYGRFKVRNNIVVDLTCKIDDLALRGEVACNDICSSVVNSSSTLSLPNAPPQGLAYSIYIFKNYNMLNVFSRSACLV